MIKTVRLRKRAQMTFLADIRRDLGVKESDDVVLVKRDGTYVMSGIDHDHDPTAGMLAKYARFRNPDPAEERR